MSVDPTHDLIGDLTDRLEPVRPVPQMRWTALAIGGAWALLVVVAVVWMEPRAELWMALTSNPSFAATLGGLLLAAAGGTLASLASRVPGREATVRGGLALAFGGLATAVGLCVAVFAASDLEAHGPVAAGMCLERAVMFAVLPAIVLVGLVIRGWVARPWIAAVAGLLGTGAVAGLAVHLHCGMDAPLHLLFGHVLAPILCMAVGAPIAAWVLRANSS